MSKSKGQISMALRGPFQRRPRRVQQDFSDIPGDPEREVRTRQEFKDDCDLNLIMRRHGSPKIPTVELAAELMGHFDQTMDLHQAIQFADHANELFMEMPSNLRAEFDNDPAKLVAFVSDDANYSRAAELGLVPKVEPSPAEPAKVEPSGA